MVKCCSAIGCASRCLPNSKLKGLTFHAFPTDENVKRKWVLAMKRLDVNSAGMWEPKKGDVLCSRHFKKTDFDRSAPNLKLKPGVIPSIFDSPYHLQDKKEKLHCRKNFTLKTLPVTKHNHQLVGASSYTEEFQSQFIFIIMFSVIEEFQFFSCVDAGHFFSLWYYPEPSRLLNRGTESLSPALVPVVGGKRPIFHSCDLSCGF
ncbi:THAP domain-containing protein 6 isoform X2 [Heterocephalus glaber]|uniref:THAP domain-containing protein 6 isoform X2 n=1 Tax=Heterocephalus glaber TaxID=10181 RepID=A0AAX6NP86_HETGA|nr:THAP domain-containing protein 6 isoform X2 [Heterocephalus glaber]